MPKIAAIATTRCGETLNSSVPGMMGSVRMV